MRGMLAFRPAIVKPGASSSSRLSQSHASPVETGNQFRVAAPLALDILATLITDPIAIDARDRATKDPLGGLA
jgi:hypothetical protein